VGRDALVFHSPHALEKLSTVQPLVYTNRAHITSRSLSKEASLKYKDSTAENLEYTASLASLTKEKCYELVGRYIQ
jgi:hypothetical protein